jgi:hypothetical protein
VSPWRRFIPKSKICVSLPSWPLCLIFSRKRSNAALSPKESEPTSNNLNEENDSYLVCVNFNDDEDEQQVRQQQQQSHTDDLLDRSTRSVASATSNAPLRSSLKRRESINEDELDKRSTSILSNTSNNNNNLRSSIKSIDSNESTSRKLKQKVSFTSLEIRSYPITLGDAPTSNGPPVSLDWEHNPQSTQVYKIDSYEQHSNQYTTFETRNDHAPLSSKVFVDARGGIQSS